MNPRSPTASFLPTLLDRLVAPTTGATSRSMSRSAYQETVMRDLRWLLNSTTSLPDELTEAHAELRNSVLNYGIKSVTGSNQSEGGMQAIATAIEQAIVAFEPRILKDSLSVTPVCDQGAAVRNQVVFRIRAAFWFEPYPLEMSIRAQWDVENGLVGLGPE